MKQYDHSKIEPKWQKVWEKEKAFEAKDVSKKPKFYALIEFPFPSGDGMHTGHLRSNTAMDIIARKRRAEGFNVLYPMGWDAFGLPTENYAIKTGKHPKVVTKENTDNFRRQLKSAGFSFDWSREVDTTDPNYYKWTQWIFLQFHKNGLAYKKKMVVNWCPKDKIVLANEEVVDGCCERCGTPVEKREKEQWMLAITKYADRLDKDLDTVDYLEKIKIQQRNWIGRSEGAELEFKIKNHNNAIKVFTTRPDTLFGVTYLVLSPEHKLVGELLGHFENAVRNRDEVNRYLDAIKDKTEMERTAEGKEKSGVRLEGVMAINPVNNELVPVFIADYVLAHYGTGAIMAVPAHDERDFAFAKKYQLPMIRVIKTEGEFDKSKPYTDEGVLVHSGSFDGMQSVKAKKEIARSIGGKMITTYKLRDWVFSRQRYWGEPIPMVFCEHCKKTNPKSEGWIPVPEKDLPVKLPEVEKYQPTDTGESPLASISSWVNTKCPVCKGPARRETDTMPNWAGSSWYFLRYIDPKNKKALADRKKLDYWMAVDWYNGGMEHTTLHLLYSRFWNKFLFDIGVVPTSEPYVKRTSHGLILAADGDKMSKSKGNTVNPDSIIKDVGADSLRVYEMFMGPFDQAVSWNDDGVVGPRRFLEKVWRLQEKVTIKPKGDFAEIESQLQKTIKKVSDDIESMQFNTAISAMMIFTNELEKMEKIPVSTYLTFVRILAPFAPHIAEELWSGLGKKKSIHVESWPKANESKMKEGSVTIVVQVNGKVRAEFRAEAGMDEKMATDIAYRQESVKKWIEGKEVKRVIYIKGKLINIVVG
jgi:leucyl-tRNA synthetase